MLTKDMVESWIKELGTEISKPPLIIAPKESIDKNAVIKEHEGFRLLEWDCALMPTDPKIDSNYSYRVQALEVLYKLYQYLSERDA